MPTKKSGPGGAPVVEINRRARPQSAEKRADLAAARARAAENNQARKAKRQAALDSGEYDGVTRWEKLVAGDMTVRELDDEELARMQTKNFHGQFAGRPPTVPNRLARQFKDEILRRGASGFNKWGPRAIEVVASIMMSPAEKGADRLRAAAIVLERVYGKVPEELRATVESAWDETFEDVSTEFDRDVESA